MDENERKLKEIKRAFVNKIEDIMTIVEMINFIKTISPQKIKDFIKNRLQQDINNQEDTIIHIEDKVEFKHNIISELNDI